MTSPGAVYLIGSQAHATVAEVVQRVESTLHARGTLRPHIAVSNAAVQSSKRNAHTRAHSFVKSHFPDAIVESFTVFGEPEAMQPSEARSIVLRADVVFMGGGDPVLMARRFVDAGADAWVRHAHERGALCIGISAGSIALGAYWASWPDDDPHGTPELVKCLGVVPDLVVDCHAEEDDWAELKEVKRLAEPAFASVRYAGVGDGSALIVRAGGALDWVGPSFRL